MCVCVWCQIDIYYLWWCVCGVCVCTCVCACVCMCVCAYVCACVCVCVHVCVHILCVCVLCITTMSTIIAPFISSPVPYSLHLLHPGTSGSHVGVSVPWVCGLPPYLRGQDGYSWIGLFYGCTNSCMPLCLVINSD